MNRLCAITLMALGFAQCALSDEITVSPLDEIKADAVGLVNAETSGVPENFWANLSSERIKQLIDSQHLHQLPEARSFMKRLLVAELAPPIGAGTTADVILSRVDYLLDNGALNEADALLTKAGPNQPGLFERWFDTKLMLNRPREACEPLEALPQLASDMSTKIYCMAQNQDWLSAEITLVNALDLGLLSKQDANLLSMFLDPEGLEDHVPIKPNAASSPLEFTIREALALPRPVRGVSLSQTHVDLDSSAGRLAQIRAAERLARVGALPAQNLFDLYLEAKEAASGGVWERVIAVTKLERALTIGDNEKTCVALNEVWNEMKRVKLEHVFAAQYASKLAPLGFSTTCQTAQINAILLNRDYQKLLFDLTDLLPEDDLRKAIVLRNFANAKPKTRVERAVLQAFQLPIEPHSIHPAEALLDALSRIKNGKDSGNQPIKSSLQTFVDLGFEEEAYRLALQLII